MKNYKSVLTLIALAAIGSSSMVAQSYYDDDIYYNPDKVKKEKVEKQKQSAKSKTINTNSVIQGSDSYVVYSNNNRDVDEYNRRNVASSPSDTAALNGNSDFAYTRRIERFYNPDVVEGSGDEELRDYYYASQIEPETTTINLIVSPDYGWYNPFYAGWYNPWYCSSWSYWNPWYGPGWWGPSYAWNWGWGPSWNWGWGPSWNWGWGPSWNWGWGPTWGPSWSWGWGGTGIPSHGRPHRLPAGAMTTHRPAVGTGYRPGSGGGRRGPAVNSNRQPSYNHNNPGNINTGGQRRGGNVRPSNSSSNRDYNINHNSNSNSSWGSGSRRGGSSVGTGGSFGGGSRSGGGARGTGGRRR